MNVMKCHRNRGLLKAWQVPAAGLVLFLLIGGTGQAATTKIPPLDCHKPVVPSASNPTATQVETYNKDLPRYRQCIKRYVSDRSSAARLYSKLAQQNAKAANNAIRQFNEVVKAAQANVKK